MKGSIKLALGIVFSISLFLSCSFLFLNAEAQTSLEKLEFEDNLIRIQTDRGDPIIDVQLLENTDQCLVDCYAILKIHPYEDTTLPQQANSNFDWKFLKAKPWMEGLVSHHFEILETTEYKVEIPEYGKKLIKTTCHNENNETYECEVEQTVQTGSHEETRYKQEYGPFEFWGETLKANQDYTIKLVGKKRAQLGTNNIEWVPTIKGIEIDEWDWWNMSWDYAKNVSYTENSGYDLTNHRINKTITFPSGHVANCTKEIRVVDHNSDPDGTELNSFVDNESYSGSYCLGANVYWFVNQTNSTTVNYTIYYGNSGATKPSYDFITDNGVNISGIINGCAQCYYSNTDYLSAEVTYEGSTIKWFMNVNATNNYALTLISRLYIDGTLEQGEGQNGCGNNLRGHFWVGGSEQGVGGSTYTILNSFGDYQYGNSTDYIVVRFVPYPIMYFYMENAKPKVGDTSGGRFGLCSGSDYNTFGYKPSSNTYITARQNQHDEELYDMRAVVETGSHILSGFAFFSGDVESVFQEKDAWNDWEYSGVNITVSTLPFTGYFVFGTFDKGSDAALGYTPVTTDDLLIERYFKRYNSTINESNWVVFSEVSSPCPSANTYINENTKFEPANQFCNDASLIINASNIILDCNGMTINGTGSGTGINNGFDNVTIRNCNMQNYDYGIFLNASMNSTLSNNVINSSSRGIYFYNGAFKNKVSDSDISDNTNYGVYIDNFIGESVEFNNTFTNNTIKSNSDYDVYVSADSYSFFINTTYDKERVDLGNLTRQWYLKVNVTEKNMNPIENASVTVEDYFDDQEWTDSTNADGMTEWKVITQYENKSGTTTYYTPQNISGSHPDYADNSTTQNITESKIVHLILSNWDITFNVTSGEDGSELNYVDIYCNYTGFNQSGDTTNPYGPYEFPPGAWSCTFSKSNYFNRTTIFNADSDKTVGVTLSESGFLSVEEHTWLEKLYNCLYLGNDEDCSALQFFNQINQSTHNTWNQFKRTDQSIVASEVIDNKTVDQNSNLTINYSINVPVKEGFTFGETSGEVKLDYLPIRLSYWFLDSNNLTCYSQGNYSVALAEPHCQPLTVYSIGQVNTTLNFTVELRPTLPAGTYTIVRNIEIDPQQVWINYGQEIIGQVEVLKNNELSYLNVKNMDTSLPKSTIGEAQEETIKEEDKTTGMISVYQINTLSYALVVISVITLILVGLIYKNSRKRTPYRY